MAKTTKNIKKTRTINYKKIVIVSLVAFITLSGLYYYNYWVRPVTAQAEITQIRSLIILGAEGGTKDAPVDPKTGDVYFPGAKLYVPAPESLDVLTYDYFDDGSSQPELSVSNKLIFSKNALKLYAANNINELFKLVPKLQACQRGVKILYSQINDDSAGDLMQTVDLPSGKKLYMYVEPECKEIEELLPLLKQIKAY